MRLQSRHLARGPHGLRNIDFYGRVRVDPDALRIIVHNTSVISIVSTAAVVRGTIADAEVVCRASEPDHAEAAQWLMDMTNVLLLEDDPEDKPPPVGHR